jgi:hypothetical protein
MIQNLTIRTQAIIDLNIRSLEFQVFSQFGEDGIINFLCETLHISKPRVLEIGVEDFQECNSHFLAYSRNASIVAVDKYPLHEDFLSTSNLRWKNTVEAWTRDVTPNNINDIYKESEVFLGAIDIFSLDIDGIDYWVFQRLEILNAKILVLEFNALYGSTRSVSVPFEENFDRTKKHFSNKYYGCSLMALIEEAHKKGYQFIGSNRACNNAFFIKRNLVSPEAFQIQPLQEYTDLTFRESRNFEGKLSYFNSKLELDTISEMSLVETSTNQLIKVKDL